MNKLGWLDIASFVLYMALSIGVGVWFTRRQKSLKSYLLADQDMSFGVVAISVIAALFSGITYLGAPAETYAHDLQYLWVLVAFFFATPVTALIFVPLFYKLKVFTAYEYLEERFDRRVRLLASLVFVLRVSLWLGVAVYAPSLVLAEVTGWPIWLSVLLVGVSTTFYTALGGMKAVIWTDVFQFGVLFLGIFFVLGYAIAGVKGGLPEIWTLAAADDKTRLFDWRLDPTIRVTFWAALIGGTFANLVQMVTDQVSVQRYLTAKSLAESQRALWLKFWITLPMVSLFYLTGTALYGYYKANPSLMPVLARPDALLPHFVINHLPSPLPGLLVASVFAATMSTVSAGINSLAGSMLMDFLQTDMTEQAQSSDAEMKRSRALVGRARWLTVLFGVFATLIALYVDRLGTLLEAPVRISGFLGGPLLGIFFLGALTRRANGTGVLIGYLVGGFACYLAEISGVSFLWLAFYGCATTFVTGFLLSLLFPAPSSKAQALVYQRNWENIAPLNTTPEARASDNS